MTSVRALACGLLVLSGIPSVQTAAQSQPLSVEDVAATIGPLAPFRSVELRNGGKAILRHGPTQRVTFLKGSPDHTQVTIASGDGLIIEKCKSTCARGYELEIEILTPELARLAVAEGGTIQSRGSFPRQAAIDVAVSNGGTIDIRSMSVASVTASVVSGGRILADPLTAMVARVVDGGSITYWGEAHVTSSIQNGGVVTRGTASDADEPLYESSPPIAPVPPIPALPPIKGFALFGLDMSRLTPAVALTIRCRYADIQSHPQRETHLAHHRLCRDDRTPDRVARTVRGR